MSVLRMTGPTGPVSPTIGYGPLWAATPLAWFSATSAARSAGDVTLV